MKNKYKEFIDSGLLKPEKINFSDVRKVLAKAQSNLKSAEILLANEQYENSFELAYEAMLSAGRALSFSINLRPRAQGSHKIIADFTEHALGKNHINIIRKFDKMRKKRHYLIYGAGLEISEIEALGAIKNAREFIEEIEKIIKEKDPQKELF
ncbi:MAG: hypothetical protein UR82_C0091G0005 [Candidatus Moranbacteria bacterium GW2011_GWF1_35_5]|nr:MAG: hypothetical protein UR82_C0091G0005 [Candidatus Moranbacteria bacterium GW2011_GWF1_35_5]KKP84864.1 MAG: hypothetical protein UR83_C0009G0005 [Candidatus Moranbacteria bacterium GW2011_GWF2_35_54]